MTPDQFDKSDSHPRYTRLSGPIAESVRSCLKEYGYPILNDLRRRSIIFHCVIDPQEPTRWRSEVRVHEQQGVAILYVYLFDPRSRVNRSNEVGELATRMNNAVALGGVVSDLDKGAVYFRNSIDFRQDDPTAEKIDTLLSSAAFSIRLWSLAYSFLIKRAAPRDALDAALFKLGAFEGEIGDEAFKLVLEDQPREVSASNQNISEKKTPEQNLIFSRETFEKYLNGPVIQQHPQPPKKEIDWATLGPMIDEFLAAVAEDLGIRIEDDVDETDS